ncbi:hypothetical protein ACJIZ3_015484 [Penstemon smallii]|uniref:Uncharacterized protein n=1 Tax=Penstemon smallii TaxID=265156 RepID=A0ABD3RQZ5_9LAMI
MSIWKRICSVYKAHKEQRLKESLTRLLMEEKVTVKIDNNVEDGVANVDTNPQHLNDLARLILKGKVTFEIDDNVEDDVVNVYINRQHLNDLSLKTKNSAQLANKPNGNGDGASKPDDTSNGNGVV